MDGEPIDLTSSLEIKQPEAAEAGSAKAPPHETTPKKSSAQLEDVDEPLHDSFPSEDDFTVLPTGATKKSPPKRKNKKRKPLPKAVDSDEDDISADNLDEISTRVGFGGYN